jgi:hypothetical protein
MFTLRYYSTKSADWQEACRSADARVVVAAFDELVGKATVPALELHHKEELLLRLGLTRKRLMKLAVWGERLRGATPSFKEKYKKARASGVKDIRAGRNRFLNALVV